MRSLCICARRAALDNRLDSVGKGKGARFGLPGLGFRRGSVQPPLFDAAELDVAAPSGSGTPEGLECQISSGARHPARPRRKAAVAPTLAKIRALGGRIRPQIFRRRPPDGQVVLPTALVDLMRARDPQHVPQISPWRHAAVGPPPAEAAPPSDVVLCAKRQDRPQSHACPPGIPASALVRRRILYEDTHL